MQEIYFRGKENNIENLLKTIGGFNNLTNNKRKCTELLKEMLRELELSTTKSVNTRIFKDL